MAACNFNPVDIIKTEIPIVQKIIRDECWLKGEKKNRTIDPAEVEDIVDKIVLNKGEQMLKEANEILKKEKCTHDCSKCPYYK